MNVIILTLKIEDNFGHDNSFPRGYNAIYADVVLPNISQIIFGQES